MKNTILVTGLVLAIFSSGCGHDSGSQSPSGVAHADKKGEEQSINDSASEVPTAQVQHIEDIVLSARIIALAKKFIAQRKAKKTEDGNYPAGHYKIDGGCGLLVELRAALTLNANMRQNLTLAESTKAMSVIYRLSDETYKEVIKITYEILSQAQILGELCERSKNSWGGKNASDKLIDLLESYRDLLIKPSSKKLVPKKKNQAGNNPAQKENFLVADRKSARWLDANQYCKERGLRLPTAYELALVGKELGGSIRSPEHPEFALGYNHVYSKEFKDNEAEGYEPIYKWDERKIMFMSFYYKRPGIQSKLSGVIWSSSPIYAEYETPRPTINDNNTQSVYALDLETGNLLNMRRDYDGVNAVYCVKGDKHNADE